MEQTAKQLRILAIFTFFLSPLFAWGSILASNETAVFASLSRMIWYSGSAAGIFIAMLVLFVPMLVAFFFAHRESNLPKTQKWACRICMIISCAVLNVFDEKSYVIASAVSELYVLTMMSLVGYLTYYLAYRKARMEKQQGKSLAIEEESA